MQEKVKVKRKLPDWFKVKFPAGENFHKALAYFEALEDYEYMVFAQQGITNMYSLNGFYEKAGAERQKNIQKIKELTTRIILVIRHYKQIKKIFYLKIRMITKTMILKILMKMI